MAGSQVSPNIWPNTSHRYPKKEEKGRQIKRWRERERGRKREMGWARHIGREGTTRRTRLNTKFLKGHTEQTFHYMNVIIMSLFKMGPCTLSSRYLFLSYFHLFVMMLFSYSCSVFPAHFPSSILEVHVYSC